MGEVRCPGGIGSVTSALISRGSFLVVSTQHNTVAIFFVSIYQPAVPIYHIILARNQFAMNTETRIFFCPSDRPSIYPYRG